MRVHLKRSGGLVLVPVLASLAFAALFLAACSSATPPPAAPAATSAPAKAAAQAEALPVISFGTGAGVQNSLWFVASEKGLFLKNGVDVKVKLFNTGSDIMTAMQAGELDMGNASFEVHITSQSKDVKFKGFTFSTNDATTVFPDDLYALTAPASANISKVEDLRGKKIASTAGTTQDTWVKAVLTKAGVPLDSVTFLNAQPNDMPSAFGAGGIDAAVTVEQMGEQIKQRYPDAKVLMRGGGYVGQRVVTTATNEMLTTKRALAEKVVAGLVESAFIIRTQPQVVAEVIPHWLTGVDGDLAVKAVSHIPFDPRMSQKVRDGWDAHAKLMLEQKKIKEIPAFEPAFDMPFLDAANKYPQWLGDLKPVQ